MQVYNELISKVRKANQPKLGKDNTHREYLIELYALNQPITAGALVTCMFKDIPDINVNNVNLQTGELVILGEVYPISEELIKIMKEFRGKMKKRTNCDPEYVFPKTDGTKNTGNNVGMLFSKTFGMSIKAYTLIYEAMKLEKESIVPPVVVPIAPIPVQSPALPPALVALASVPSSSSTTTSTSASITHARGAI